MKKQKKTPFQIQARKDTNFQTQKRKYLALLRKKSVTNTMASEILNIPQKNLCRFKRELEDKGMLAVICIQKCRITGEKAQYLTADPFLMLFASEPSLKIIFKDGSCV